MNIFYIHPDPYVAAQQMVDRHVVKMILESAQLLSTAHRLLDGREYADKTAAGRSARRWLLSDVRENVLYKATHMQHPSNVWVRQSSENYNWLYNHFLGLMNEYTFRYGKQHLCERNDISLMLMDAPTNIRVGVFTPPTPAMPDEYKVANDSLSSYRNYYKQGKAHLHKYTKREMPDWIISCP